MSRRSKWLKWQISGGITLVISLVLTAVRVDPAFSAAQQKKMETQVDRLMAQNTPRSKDKVLEEFRQERERVGNQGARSNLMPNHRPGSTGSGQNMHGNMSEKSGVHTMSRWS